MFLEHKMRRGRKEKPNVSKKKIIAAILGVAVIALIGALAFRSIRSDDPERNADSIAEMTVQTGEESEAVSDLPVSGAEDKPEVIAEQPVTEPEEEPEVDPGQVVTEPEADPYVVLNQTVTQQDNDAQLAAGRIITAQPEDKSIIPDRYNCGAWGGFTKVLASDTVNGIVLKESGGINSFDFFNRNTDIVGEIYFSGYDFSDYIIEVYNADQIDREITLVFVNCKFSIFRSLTNYPKVKLIFTNCTFNSFYGSCAEFNYCKFGSFYKDGLVPLHDVTVRNCYFSDFSSQDTAGTGVHTDGTQIYGKEGVNAENIRYEHCRFEVPHIPGTNAINSCIMLQMEYSNGINISFSDCIVNGGGYTIYASAKRKGFEYYRNVSFTNIAVGQSRMYGPLYPTVSDGIEFTNIFDIDSLYVASVWKGNGKTHLSVTNDTLQDRLLVVYADGVKYDFIIPASRGGKTDYFERFEDYPIDLDICIDADCQNVVCFDCTTGVEKQIRFVTWDGSDSISIPL